MPSPKKRSNPNNPLCSSMIQHILEYKDLGGSMSVTLTEFLKLAQEDPEVKRLIREADKAVDRKGYPDSAITFHKTDRGVQVHNFLSGRDNKVIGVIASGIDQANLLQISTRDIERAAGLNRTAACESIQSLLAQGCIAVERPGTRNIASIYMLNPEIATVGNSKASRKRFWTLTGSKYEDNGRSNEVEEYSEPHKTWINMTASRVYTVGSKSEGKYGDPEFRRYNVLHFLGDKKTAPSLGEDEAAASESDVDL